MHTTVLAGITAAVLVAACSPTSSDPTFASAADAYAVAGSYRSESKVLPLVAPSESSEVIVGAEFVQLVLAGEAPAPAANRSDMPTGRWDSASKDFDVLGHLRVRTTHEAVAAARVLTEQSANDPNAHHIMGVALLVNGEWSAARQSFNSAIKVDASHALSTIGLARLDVQEGRTDAALDRFEKVLATGQAPAALVTAYEGLLQFAGLDRRDARLKAHRADGSFKVAGNR